MTTSPSQCRRKRWLRCCKNGFPKMNLIILKCDDRKLEFVLNMMVVVQVQKYKLVPFAVYHRDIMFCYAVFLGCITCG